MGIQKRLLGSYVIVSLITIAILEIILIAFVNYYYYHNVERILINQAELSASFFQQYFDEVDFKEQSARLLKGVSENSAAQVQIIDATGQILQDSMGYQSGENIVDFQDVQEAKDGNIGIWRGSDPSSDEAILAVSYPLQANETIVGFVRFVTSLTGTQAAIRQITTIFITIGLFVLAIVAVLSVLVSRTITSSIKELKLAAGKMAEGDFNVTIKQRYKDELGTLSDTLNMMAAKIRRDEQLKNDFISSVSHELRTPLTSIKGWAVTLQSSEGDDQQLLRDGLEIIETESDRLTSLVDELLDLSKLDNGQIILSCAPLAVGELLQHIGKQLTPRADRQHISLNVRIPDNLPIILADENRMKQVLINLIDNALKFTEPDGVISMYAYLDSRQRKVIITVEDTGVGISEQDLNSVFRKFYKGSDNTAGSGLGLSISKQIMELHGGELRIHSQLGKGTKIEMYLPQ
ncbi:MAG TPA: cell wall metabolism sensor histidine kinase WalK [Candidatus Paenibacillus intestinavium]|nr:cell wall metabolism sensor histidine kinase WalK [Candidatus Paenibacillus intestinavium]